MIFRDALQFATMLVLVRLLSSSDYGSFALAQAIVGFLGVVAANRFVIHALQYRDPAQIDWQAHFTAATVLNGALCVGTLGIAYVLSFFPEYEMAALPLSVASVAFLIDAPATIRLTMLQAQHDWRRFRTLLVVGALFASAAGLAVAFSGGGALALAVQPLLIMAPAACDLLASKTWRPDWTWSWPRYRASFYFGVNRMVGAGSSTGRAFFEQASIVGQFDFAALGVFSRAIGLVTLTAGRLGTVATSILYPVITRVEKRSTQFRRVARIIFTSVAWITIGAATFTALAADDLVRLLYGAIWIDVAELLPLAALYIGASGLSSTLSHLLLANDESRLCVILETSASVLGVALALWLIPIGPRAYLFGVGAMTLLLSICAAILLAIRRGIDATDAATAVFTGIAGAVVASGAVAIVRAAFGVSDFIALRLSSEALVFGVSFVATLRFMGASLLAELLEAALAGERIARILGLSRSESRPAVSNV